VDSEALPILLVKRMTGKSCSIGIARINPNTFRMQAYNNPIMKWQKINRIFPVELKRWGYFPQASKYLYEYLFHFIFNRIKK